MLAVRSCIWAFTLSSTGTCSRVFISEAFESPLLDMRSVALRHQCVCVERPFAHRTIHARQMPPDAWYAR